MTNETFLIQPCSEGFYTSPGNLLPFSNTSFPDQAARFRNDKKLLWEVQVVQQSSRMNEPMLDVLDYDSNKWDVFRNQRKVLGWVVVAFRALDYEQLKPCLSWSDAKQLRNFLQSANSPPASFMPSKSLSHQNQAQEKKKAEQQPRELRLEVQYPIRRIVFFEGFGQFRIGTGDFYGLRNGVLARVDHPDSREAFSTVAKYIERALGKKKIKAELYLREKADGSYELLNLTSDEFLGINEDLIEDVKYQLGIEQLQKAETGEIFLPSKDDMVVTGIDFLDQLGIEEDELHRRLLSEKSSIHFHELNHLSQMQEIDHDILLKVVQNPDLGFLFFVVKDDFAYWIYETYKVNRATYIWKISLEGVYIYSRWVSKWDSDIEKEFVKMRDLGRLKYRSNAPVNFRYVQHVDSEGGFRTWRNRLDEILES